MWGREINSSIQRDKIEQSVVSEEKPTQRAAVS